MVLVVLGGLLLGGLLTKFFGGGAVHAPTPQPSFTPLPEATATYAPTAMASPSSVHRAMLASAAPSASASASPAATASASPSVRPAATPKAMAASARPTSSATPPIVYLTPNPEHTNVAQTPAAQPSAASATPTPVLITGENTSGHAVAIVHAYLSALARGDSSTAAGYLAGGLPTENFVNPNVSVNVSDLSASRNDDGSYTVTAQIVTSKGTYVETFTLRSSPLGMQITDHNASHI